MEFRETYDIAYEMINKAGEKFREDMVLNDTQFLMLESVCAIVDNLINDFECESVEVTADETNGDLRIKVVCFEMVIRESEHYFYELLKMVNGVHFTKHGDDDLAIEFILSNMWVKVSE